MGWLSRSHQRKLPQSLLMFVAFAAKHFHQLTKKHNLLLGHDSPIRLVYILALEDIKDKLHRETDYPKQYVGAVTRFCDIMDKADVERNVTFVGEKAQAQG